MTESELLRFISSTRLGVLATIAADGKPQSALVGFAVGPDLEVVFDTVKSSRKYANLSVNKECSFVFGWSGEQTVQYEGEAVELKALELERYQAIYFNTWPDGPTRMKWPEIVYFAVHPRWIRYSDFDQSPPFIREFTFPKSL